jgi:hypothetical protein
LLFDQFLNDFQLFFVKFAGDLVTTVDPAAQIDEFAAFRTEREERLIAQPFECECLAANGAVGGSHFELDAEDEEEEVLGDEDAAAPELPLSLDFEEEAPAELAELSALAALLYESDR